MRHDGPAHTARPDNPPPTITYRRDGVVVFGSVDSARERRACLGWTGVSGFYARGMEAEGKRC